MVFVHKINKLMDQLNNILNFLLPPLTLIFFFFIYPFYIIIKLLIYVITYFRFENVTGKVILITGASSGIGEHLAYEYAKKGANLVLVARRKDRLQIVAEKSRMLGSRDVIVIAADVAKVEDCKYIIDETIQHFRKLDHLVNNAGVLKYVLFEDYTQIQEAMPTIDINFWGSVYITHFAIPHLRKNKGKIIVMTSGAANVALPLESIYCASKAALLRFFETLKIEISPEINITIVIPGFVSTDMITPYSIEKYGSELILSESVSKFTKSTFKGIRRGESYIVKPSWMKCVYLMNNLCPEITEYIMNYSFIYYLKPAYMR